jgi:hypothetical protein
MPHDIGHAAAPGRALRLLIRRPEGELSRRSPHEHTVDMCGDGANDEEHSQNYEEGGHRLIA